MGIKLTSKQPVRRLPYKIPLKLEDAFKEELERLLKLSIIRKSSSEYASFPILKKNRAIRLDQDFRPINKIKSKNCYPFPDLWEEPRSIPKSNFFLKLT